MQKIHLAQIRLDHWWPNPLRNCLVATIPCWIAATIYLLVYPFPYPFPDAIGYQNLGNQLAHSGQFGSSQNPGLEQLSYERTPGYPVILALFHWLGAHGFWIANLLFLWGIVCLTIQLAEKWGIKPWWPVLVLFSSSAGLLACTTVPLTEICFLFWLMMTIYFLDAKPLLASLCLSWCTLTRPISMLLFVPLALWLIWKKKAWMVVILFCIGANLLPLGWTVRNYLKTGFGFYTTLGGHYLLHYKVGSYLSYKENKPFDEVRAQLHARLPPHLHPVLRNQKEHELGMALLQENLWGFCLWAPQNFLYFWMPDITPLLERLQISKSNQGTYDILRREGVLRATVFYFSGNQTAALITLCYALYYLGLLLFALAGLYRFYREKVWEALSLSILLILYFAILPLGNLDWRFRVPVMPICFILAASGMMYGKHCWCRCCRYLVCR